MTIASERGTDQTPLVGYAKVAGWSYLPPHEALRLRGGEDQPFLKTVLRITLECARRRSIA